MTSNVDPMASAADILNAPPAKSEEEIKQILLELSGQPQVQNCLALLVYAYKIHGVAASILGTLSPDRRVVEAMCAAIERKVMADPEIDILTLYGQTDGFVKPLLKAIMTGGASDDDGSSEVQCDGSSGE